MTIHRFSARLGLAAALLLAGSAQAACNGGKPLRFAGITWESGQFFTEVIRTLVEARYGCKTEVVNGSTAATETALVNGDLDLWVEQWNRTEVIKKGLASGRIKLVGDLLADGGASEGFFVPEYVIKGDAKRGIKPMAPDLKSIADLPRYKALFRDEEEPDKGRLLSCPVGWDCERINTQKLKAYKLEGDYTNFRAGTGAALDAAIASAVERGKPVLFYYWSPAGLMGKYKFIQIREPDFDAKCWETLKDAKVKNPCPSATPNTRLTVGMSTTLMQADPALLAFIEKVQIKPELVNAAIARMGDQKLSATVVAKDFLKAHGATWKAWMTPAAAESAAASLK